MRHVLSRMYVLLTRAVSNPSYVVLMIYVCIYQYVRTTGAFEIATVTSSHAMI